MDGKVASGKTVAGSSFKLPVDPYKNFKPGALMKHPALIPLAGITLFAMGLSSSYITYMLLTKSDYSFNVHRSWADDAPYAYVKPEKINKIYATRSKFTPDEDEIALQKEIGCFKN